jgi:hypothetical protein
MHHVAMQNADTYPAQQFDASRRNKNATINPAQQFDASRRNAERRH